jgi:hypothetical protein
MNSATCRLQLALRPRLGLALLVMSLACWANPQENRRLQELPKRAVMELAQRDLDSVESVLRSNPQDRPLQWMQLRLLHALSVENEARIAQGLEAASQFEMGVNSEEIRMVAKAYRGAFHVVIAKHAFWPNRKMDALKQGLPDLDSAVNRLPNQMEIRYLRLVSCYYLPFFLGRKWSVKEDLDALAKGLPAYKDHIPGPWFLGISEFVLKHADMDNVTRDKLLAAYWLVHDTAKDSQQSSERHFNKPGGEG